MKAIEQFWAYEAKATSFDPTALARIPQIKALVALDPGDRVAVAVELAEGIAKQVTAKRSPWLLHSVIELVVGRKRLPWTAKDLETLVRVAATVNDAGTTRFPIMPLVLALEQYRAAGGAVTAKLRAGATKVAGYLRGNGVTADGLAQRLTNAVKA